MPSFTLYGRKWHVGADDGPVFAAFGALFHAFWLARQDILAVAALMIFFVIGFILEVSLIYEGCRGTIFQLSKRRQMGTLVTCRFFILALETATTAYGTYVVFFTSVECIVSETETWNPQREIMVLILMTWVFQALTLLNAFIWYNAWPEHHVPEMWENRFVWIGRWVCCQPTNAGETRQQSLRRIARWVTALVAHVDLTASDVAVGLILVATLQRSRRRQHLRRCIQEAAAAAADQQQHEDLASPGEGLQPAVTGLAEEGRSESIIYTHEEKEAVLKLGVLPAGGNPAALPGAAASTLAAEPDTSEAHECGYAPRSNRSSSQLKPEEANSGMEGSASVPVPLQSYVQAMQEQQDACLTPSGMDQPLRESMPAEEVVQAYTGHHWHVDLAALTEAAHYALYAEAAYGVEATRPSRLSRWKNEVQIAWKRKRRKGRAGAVNTDQLGTLYERLSHEAIQDQTSAAGGELLYVSFHNTELAHLPYFVTLDHHKKSVVVAVRGTATMEDIVTDSVAQPEPLQDWLPEDIHQEAAACSEGFHAHGGMMEAARHVLQDLDQQGLLHQLLRGQATCHSPPQHPHDQSSPHPASPTHRDTHPNAPPAAVSTPFSHAEPPPAHGQGRHMTAATSKGGTQQDSPHMASSSGSNNSRQGASIQPGRSSRGMAGEGGPGSSPEDEAGRYGDGVGSFPVSPSTSESSEDMFRDDASAGRGLQGEKGQEPSPGTKVDSRPAAEGRWVAEIIKRKLDCKGWRLVVTGHSLGAGVATLVALALRSRFPDVHCYAFSPPGGMVSRGLGRYTEAFVTSLVVGKDMVPRMSMPNLARMIDQMVAALALCKHNKARLLAGRLTVGWRHKRARQLFWRYDQIPEECLQVLAEYKADIETRSSMLEMVPPGRLMFLRPHKVDGKRSTWDAVWLDAIDIIKEGILISPKMYEDHYLNSLRDALETAKNAAASGADVEQGHSYVAPELVEGLQRP